MATRYWIGGVSTNPQDRLNWSGNIAPVSGDDVVFGELAESSCVGVLSEDSSSTEVFLNSVLVEDDFDYDYQLGSSESTTLSIMATTITINRPWSLTRYGDYYIHLDGERDASGDLNNNLFEVIGGQWGNGYVGPYSVVDDSPNLGYELQALSLPSSRLFVSGNVVNMNFSGTHNSPIYGTIELYWGSDTPSVCEYLTVEGRTKQFETQGIGSRDNFRVLVHSKREGHLTSQIPLAELNVRTESGVEVYCFAGEITDISTKSTYPDYDFMKTRPSRNMVLLGSPHINSTSLSTSYHPLIAVDTLTMTSEALEVSEATSQQIYRHNWDVFTRQDVFCVYPTAIETLIMSGGFLRFLLDSSEETGLNVQDILGYDCILAHYIHDGVLGGESVIKIHDDGEEFNPTSEKRFFIDNLQIRSDTCHLEFPSDSSVRTQDTDFSIPADCEECYQTPYSSADGVGSSGWWATITSSEDINSSVYPDETRDV